MSSVRWVRPEWVLLGRGSVARFSYVISDVRAGTVLELWHDGDCAAQFAAEMLLAWLDFPGGSLLDGESGFVHLPGSVSERPVVAVRIDAVGTWPVGDDVLARLRGHLRPR